ncbi:hypothetical protein L917_21546 [Phytophthora nicotianae]|uniref:Uncharacterized protein n=1 Tax=Phytophthora nicotianae TaxID=4792 RepID=W2M9A3_PHYNI|nr:hypothetical protein L915_02188 [Phytophthora nicotianae]ETL48215.1 hypothetical protein L916_02149 [Phytophthora nicotianae]ETL77512.1 hypothetical protein L917_21546 [Phytophthora nicotianae]ETM32972.1 hypothetical protein L914_19733 [Phytophthora nicotianae]
MVDVSLAPSLPAYRTSSTGMAWSLARTNLSGAGARRQREFAQTVLKLKPPSTDFPDKTDILMSPN